MGISREAETKVPDVLGLVNRLQQGTDQHRLDQVRIGPVGDLEQYAQVVFRLRLGRAGQLNAHLLQEGLEVIQLVHVRAIVHPIQDWQRRFGQELCRADVGHQHALFNQAMGLIAHHWHYGADLACFAKHDPCFGADEVQCSCLLSQLGKALVNGVERFQGGHQRSVFRSQPLLGAHPHVSFRLFENIGHFVVGHACMGVDDAFIEVVIQHLTELVYVHLTDHDQSVHLRLQ